MQAERIVKRDQTVNMEDIFNKVSALFEVYNRLLEKQEERPMDDSSQVGLMNLCSDVLTELEILTFDRNAWDKEKEESSKQEEN